MRPTSIALALPFLLSTMVSQAYAQQSIFEVDPPLTGGAGAPLPVSLGYGWNFISSNVKATSCVTGKPATDTPRTTYQTVGDFSDNSTLAKALKISASAQASFIIGSAEAQTSYALNQNSSLSLNRVAIYASIRDLNALTGTEVSLPPSELNAKSPPLSTENSVVITPKGIELKPEYVKMLIDNDIKSFEMACGGGYVQAKETGADLIAFYSYDTSSLDSQRQVIGSLKGSVLGQSASAGVDSLIKTVNESSAQLIDYRQFGGSPTALPVNKDGFLTAIKEFPKTITKENSKLYKLYVASYGPETIANWPPNIAPLAINANSSLSKLVEQYWLADAIYRQLEIVIAEPNKFIFSWGTNLDISKEHQAKILEIQRKLLLSIKGCYEGKSCDLPPFTSNAEYYNHLVRLPLPVAWSPEYSSLLAAHNRAKQLVAEYNQFYKNLVIWSQTQKKYQPGQGDPTCYWRNRLAHEMMIPFYNSNAGPALNTLRLKDQDLPVQLQSLLRTSVLEATKRTRCGLGYGAFGCASALELDAWVKQMPMSGPHGVKTNESDGHIFGECPHNELTYEYTP